MNKFIILLCTALLTLTVEAQKPFLIKGRFSEMDQPMKVMLTYHNGEKYLSDSAIARNGKFSFRGKVLYPWMASLEFKPLTDQGNEMSIEKMLARDVQNFYLDAGTTRVKGSKEMKLSAIKGGKAQAEYSSLQQQVKPHEAEMKPMQEAYGKAFREKNEEVQKKYSLQIRDVRLKINKAEEDFIRENPDSYVSLGLLDRRAVIIKDSFDPLYSGLSNEMKNTKPGKEMGEKLLIARKTGIGKPAIDFTQNNTEGKPVSLSSLAGKYVFLDFWASWCGPCRAENPNVLKAYEKFKSRNFEIIAVSLDDKKEPWLEAIKKDGLPWIHVSDLKGWKNEAAREYGVSAVPFNLLLDPNGIIIAKNLRGEDLDKKLEEFIK